MNGLRDIVIFESCWTKSFLYSPRESLDVTFGVSGSPGIMDYARNPVQNLKDSLVAVGAQSKEKKGVLLPNAHWSKAT